MPNQRDSKKRMLGVYLTEEELENLKEIARRKGISQTDLVKHFIAEYVEKKNEDNDHQD